MPADLIKKNFKIPELNTDRIVLRKFDTKDADDILSYKIDPEVTKYVPWDFPGSLNDIHNFINLCKNKYKDNQEFDLAIVLKSNKKVIGGCGYNHLDFSHSWGEAGYALYSQDYWNKGIATEALKLLIRFGFTEMHLNRIEAMCMLDNLASEKVMIKSGMKFEGISRGRFYSNNNYHDAKMYSILKQESLF